MTVTLTVTVVRCAFYASYAFGFFSRNRGPFLKVCCGTLSCLTVVNWNEQTASETSRIDYSRSPSLSARKRIGTVGWVKEAGLGLVVHFPVGCAAEINTPWP
jgi:hypothetical protein